MSGREWQASAKSALGARVERLINRVEAFRAARARPATGFTSQPEPRMIGSFARGRQLLAGNFQMAGFLIEGPKLMIWDLPMPDPSFEAALHGCTWLNDLAAVGDAKARARAQDWVFDWIKRYSKGTGCGWSPDLTGRRLIRWINNAILLLNGKDRAQAETFFRTLAQQTLFLSRRWHTATPGLPRFEALTGLIYAGLALTGMEQYAGPAAAALAEECETQIDQYGGIPTRNPEELLEVFTLLTWAAQALTEAGRRPEAGHLVAIAQIAPTLRALRHADGGLARFHGGGRGLEGRLDQALAASGVRATPHEGLAMGFARVQAGRTSLVMDALPPPEGAASRNAHASTLAFEMTSARRPLIVNCGSGAAFGPEWHRAGRATPSHSTLTVTGYSSSRISNVTGEIIEAPHTVWTETELSENGTFLRAGHDGYVPTHGLTHIRELTLALDGARLDGTDTLGAISEADRAQFERLYEEGALEGIGFDIRFHLHPDVDAKLDLGGTAVSLVLKSGEVWIFRHDGTGDLALERSVYLETGRLRPRGAQQIVISARVHDFACQIGWTLAKAQDTPAAIRDTDRAP